MSIVVPKLVVTTADAPFVRMAVDFAEASAAADVTVDPRKAMQVIDGFGGAFNEQGWEALSVLTAPARDAVMKAIFDPVEGLRFNVCRTPIGASDYAIDRYTLDESPDDFAMESFSIDRDRQRLIPYVKAALKVRPDLKIWASAWTPPTWMKTTGAFDGGKMKDDPRIYAAYALYLAKFVESYRAEGIDVFMVVPQNEPAWLTQYPSCGWTEAQYIAFIGEHLGPLLRSRGAGTSIWAGTFNVPTWDVASVLRDPRAGPFIGGVCLQWGGLGLVEPLRAAFPDKPIMQSETECGNNFWEPGYDAVRAPNDFAYGAYTWRKLRDFISAGCSSYMLWNMVLDERAKNLDAKAPWPQNSAVVVDRSTKMVTYTPMFWATKHFSGLVDPGARLVESRGAYADCLAFANPDETVIVELLNAEPAARDVRVSIRSRQVAFTLPARSFASLIVPPPPCNCS